MQDGTPITLWLALGEDANTGLPLNDQKNSG